MRLVMLSIVLLTSLYASPLSDLVDESAIVKAKKQEVRSKAASIEGINYKNPVMTIAINDLPANSDFTDRSLEPMQTTSIGLTQEIETFGKLGVREQIARIEYEIAVLNLEAKRIATAKQLESLVLLRDNAQERLKLLQKRKSILDELLSYEQSQVSEVSFTKVIDVQKRVLKIDDLIVTLIQKIEEFENAFEAITGTPFQSLNVTYSDNISAELIRATPLAGALRLEQRKKQLLSRLEALKERSNVILGIAYNHRQEWDDFFNVSLSFALPVYDTEEARAKAVAMQSEASGLQLEDFIIRSEKEMQTLTKRLESLTANMQITEKLQADLNRLLVYNSNMAGNRRSISKNLENTLALVDLEEQMINYELQRSQVMLSLKYLTMERLP